MTELLDSVWKINSSQTRVPSKKRGDCVFPGAFGGQLKSKRTRR